MYFFKLEPLREQLAGPGLTERDRFKYVMAWMVTTSVMMGLSGSSAGSLKTGAVLMDLLITVFGVRYAWRRNGADLGTGFFDRYFSIGWVVMFRALVALILVSQLIAVTPLRRVADFMNDAGGFAASFASSDEEPQDTGEDGGAFAVLIGLIASLYVARATGNHIGRVREAAEQRGGVPSPAPAGALPATRPQPWTPAPPSSAPGLDRFVESVVQRELAAGPSGLRRAGRRRSTIRPLRTSRKTSRKPKRRRR